MSKLEFNIDTSKLEFNCEGVSLNNTTKEIYLGMLEEQDKGEDRLEGIAFSVTYRPLLVDLSDMQNIEIPLGDLFPELCGDEYIKKLVGNMEKCTDKIIRGNSKPKWGASLFCRLYKLLRRRK